MGAAAAASIATREIRVPPCSPRTCRCAVPGWHGSDTWEVQAMLVDDWQIGDVTTSQERAPFHAVLRLEGASTGIDLIGEFDLAAAPTFDRVVDSLEGLDQAVLCVDLAQVTFIDAAGLSALVRADRRLRSRGMRLELLRPPGRVRWLLDVALLDHLVVDAAPLRAALRGGRSADASR